MSNAFSPLELACTRCSWSYVCSLESMIQRLQAVNMLRKVKNPEPDVVVELLKAAAPNFSCPKCGTTGLLVRPPLEESEDWGGPKPCQACGKPIDRERLEVFPDSTLCVACQRKDESGAAAGEDYCPRCGSRMTVRLSRGAGISRYVLSCPQCGR